MNREKLIELRWLLKAWIEQNKKELKLPIQTALEEIILETIEKQINKLEQGE